MDLLCVGHAAYDLTMTVNRHPQADEKLQASSMQTCGGGPAANAAVQAARLGGRSSFCGYLGNDLYGDAHVTELKSENVDLTCLVRGSHPSSISQILANWQNSVVITLGEHGLIWAHDGQSGSLSAFAADAIDFTGAGDAFHGAFALGLARGMVWHDLLRFASATGALACTRLLDKSD